MHKTTEIFLYHLFDYAGIYMPAGLNLQDSFENFIAFKNSENGNMLSRFICPVGSLPNLSELIGSYHYEKDFPVCIILYSTNEITEFFDKLESNILCFGKINPNIKIESVETLLPNEIFERNNFLFEFTEKLISYFNKDTEVYLEVSTNELNYRTRYDYLAKIPEELPGVGIKLRTGGSEARSFPPPDKAAYCIRLCSEKHIPFKASFGLEYPYTHYSTDMHTTMYGFVNLIGTGLLSEKLNMQEHIEMLEDEEINNFEFTDSYFRWKNHKIRLPEIKKARQLFRSVECSMLGFSVEEL